MSLRVCFVALNACPVIDPEIPGPIGGIETRSWMLAQGLARHSGIQVDFAVRHGRPLRQTQIDGVQLHLLRDRLYQQRESLALRLHRSKQFPWIQLQSPCWSDVLNLPVIALQRLWRKRSRQASIQFFQQIPADLFLTFGVQGNSARVITAAHQSGRPAILFLGSDSDLDDRYLQHDQFISPYHDSAATCRWAIEHADGILCQTESQREKLKLFQRDGFILPNPMDFECWDAGRTQSVPAEFTCGLSRYALWVGRAESVHKQPILLVELARRTPEVSYLMILNRRDDAVERQVRQLAPANVHIVERVPFSLMPAIMQRAAVLVNTSSLEGFPNTYLQAAASGVPIASLNVEAKFLADSQAGRCAAGNLETLAEFVREDWTGRNREQAIARARIFLEQRHSLIHQSQQLAEYLRKFAR